MIVSLFCVASFFLGVGLGALVEHRVNKKAYQECEEYEDNLDDIILSMIGTVRDIESRLVAIEKELCGGCYGDTITLEIPKECVEDGRQKK